MGSEESWGLTQEELKPLRPKEMTPFSLHDSNGGGGGGTKEMHLLSHAGRLICIQ